VQHSSFSEKKKPQRRESGRKRNVKNAFALLRR
jgi:hypothetical protein